MIASFERIVYLVLITYVLDNVTATCPDTHTESWKKKNENCSDGKKYHCQYDAETQLKVDFCATPLQCEAGKRAALHSEKETISCEECGPDMYQPESKWSYKFIQPNCDRRVELCPENTIVCKEASSTQNNLCKCDHAAGYKPDTIQDCGCFDPQISLCHCIQSDCEDEILSEAYECIPAGNSSSSSPVEVTTQGNERSSQVPEPKKFTFLNVGLPLIGGVCIVVLVVVLVMMKRKKKMCFQNQNSETSATKCMIFCNCCYNENHSITGMKGGIAKNFNLARQVEGGVGNTYINNDNQGTTPNSEVDAEVEREGEVEDITQTRTPNLCDDNDITTDGDQEAGAPLVDKDDL